MVKAGVIKTGDKATLSVDETRRHNICRNHSATHLLQKALREVLGTHVEQSGSYQDGERTRFDFSHFQAMTAEELKKVEELVNKEIAEDLCVDTQVMSIEEAKKSGAMALFGEKYADDVRVVSMGDFSKELCGGTHVSHTGDIGMFKIISENSVASGVRRITAITGDNVRAYYENIEEKMNMICHAMRTTPDHLADEIKSMLGLVKDLTAEVKELKAAAARDSLGNIMDNVKEVMGVKMVAASVPGADMNSLRDLADNIKTKIGEGVVVLASDMDGKANLVVMATDEAQKRKAHAGNLIKQLAALIGGGGGGRPNMAQAGGKNPAGIPEMIGKAEAYLEEMMK